MAEGEQTVYVAHARPAPWHFADSPLFWLAMFSGVAVFALSIIWTKYEQRQAKIEANFQMRESLRGRAEVPLPANAFEVPPEPDLLRSLRPLVLVFGILFPASLLGLLGRWFVQCRRERAFEKTWEARNDVPG
ncbi:MAG: hypothetical protein WD688_06705 [Candidatus Binatia bacterium]